ncbi:hypothetical protein EUA93_05175 [Nocardioides oleivorans]|uniref:WD40 repeat domain-containing protein n=1 Tax=Nocardioides oleivorans TaxID=273676 RepID=A0A4Q2S0I0_9ACTN|nr:hypothetical protein [Nocardioides oleivorans]RYB93804.1 hypothetical protein EUA93_05175 [Nocardioides oleivorans]
MSTDLREELDALASTQTFTADPSAWDRGRRARRRSQVTRGAAVLAVLAVVVGVGALALQPDREARTADTEVPGGALPSEINRTNVPFTSEVPRGRASVAFVDNGAGITLIGAENGDYHQFAYDDPERALSVDPLVALSPDGMRLAWTGATDRIVLADLATGETTAFAHNQGRGAEVTSLAWRTDSTTLMWNGDTDGEAAGGYIDVTGPSEYAGFDMTRYGTYGFPSPSADLVALASQGEVSAAPFESAPDRQRRIDRGQEVDRPLPTELYPDGAVVTPVGWADEDLVVAMIDPPPSDVVERPRLAVFTSPGASDPQWREFLPDLPDVTSLSFAVDLVPDLTGDPDQELTHDFGD